MHEHGTPIATYRLQLNRHFRLEDARRLVPYLSRLGITHLYSSPILRARSGSMHGYDSVDPKMINPDLGDESDFRSLVTSLQAYGMGVLLDIVPNHMAASSVENPYWQDVLMLGWRAPHANWFDIDWRQADPQMWARVLVPVLGAPLSRVLEDDQLNVAWREGRLAVRYFDHVFPLDPVTVPMVFRFGLEQLDEQMLPAEPLRSELRSLLDKLESLPHRALRLRANVDLPLEDIQTWLSQLAQIIASSPQNQRWAEETAAQFGTQREGRRRLRTLLQAQNYRLLYWRRAARVINYRRFFDIDDLISVRQEDPQVFAETHETLERWIRDEWLDGLRVDHLDGLADPRDYVHRLRELVSVNKSSRYPRLIFVEKILAADEKLRTCWPVDGTTGYGFMNQVESLLISAPGFAEMEADYRRLLRRAVRFADFARWGKRRVLRQELSAYVGRLADLLVRLARESQFVQWAAERVGQAEAGGAGASPAQTETLSGSRLAYDVTRLKKRHMVDALIEVTAALPVYRTYTDHRAQLHPDDRRYLEFALTSARTSPRASPQAIDFLQDVLLLEYYDELPDHVRQRLLSFIQRFQQLTGPAAAKGIEDTALYAYVPLVSRNEVGGAPDSPLENAVETLHASNSERAALYPREMLCVTTHDSKRSADVRARLDVLSELPRLWSGYVSRWRRLNRPHRSRVRGRSAPDTAAEYLFYQSLIGIWPAPDPRASEGELPTKQVRHQLRERLEDYMLKAVREAKTRTRWVDGDAEFEEALNRFVRGCLEADEAGRSPFLNDINALVARIARAGFWNSLARTVIQYTSPGTPDLYQGDELWNFALVDPDNRQAVDYSLRQCLLDEVVLGMETPLPASLVFLQQLVEVPEDGRLKLHLIHALLRARRDYAELFAGGDYQPLQVEGPLRDHVFAYARTRHEQAAIIVTTRFTTSLVASPASVPAGWQVWGADNRIAIPSSLRGYAWRSLLTPAPSTGDAAAHEESLAVADALELLPAAVLLGEPAKSSASDESGTDFATSVNAVEQ